MVDRLRAHKLRALETVDAHEIIIEKNVSDLLFIFQCRYHIEILVK